MSQSGGHVPLIAIVVNILCCQNFLRILYKYTGGTCVHDMDVGVRSKDYILSFSHEYLKVDKTAVSSAVACLLHTTESLETASSVVEASVDLEAPHSQGSQSRRRAPFRRADRAEGDCGLKCCVYTRVAKVASTTCQHTCWMSDMYSSV